MGKIWKKIEDAFTAAAVSEERPFKESAGELLHRLEEDEVTAAMAEGGTTLDEKDHPRKETKACTIEDTDCFLHRNE